MTMDEKLDLNKKLIETVKKRNKCLEKILVKRNSAKNFMPAKFIIHSKKVARADK